MLKVLRLLLAGPRPLDCRIYPPGIDMDTRHLQGNRVVVVIELP